MNPRPSTALLRLALRRSLEIGVLLVGLVWLGSAVEAGEGGLGLIAILALLGPVAAASGTAMAVAELRQRGEWSAWEGLGYSPQR